VRGGVVLPPVTQTLRLGTLDAWGPGWIRKSWTPDPDLLNVDGSLFGGCIAALADQALTFAAMTVVPDGMVFRTLNLSVRFHRVGKAEPLRIEGKVTSQTRQIISVSVELLRPDGKPIAEASAQQFLQPMVRSVTG
jgi:uncharacterized protein (TIGR00369 family)